MQERGVIDINFLYILLVWLILRTFNGVCESKTKPETNAMIKTSETLDA